MTLGIDPCARLGFDATAPIWSESVALFVTSEDARRAVSLRLCRYPSAGTAWVWAHVFDGDRAWGHNLDHTPCDRSVTAVESDDAAYAVDGVRFIRHGPRADPSGASVDFAVGAHARADAPDEPGPVALRLRAAFTPGAAAGATLPGRSELLGDARVEVEVDGEAFTIEGRAQFHEQHQDAPRFVVPFTYASLRGPDTSLIALVGPRASGGFARVDGVDVAYRSARFPDPVDGTHTIELERDDGTAVSGDARVVHTITIPVHGRPWWGTLVTATVDGRPVSGSVNRWRFSPAPAAPDAPAAPAQADPPEAP